MKKQVFSALVGTFFILGVLLSTQVTHAEASGTKGSTYSVSENPNCASGIMHRCVGTGKLCNLTIGWDCADPKPGFEQ